MCTVTYIPTEENDFIFTSNRDEAPKRAAIRLLERSYEHKKVLFPQDELAKGTWIAISDANQLVCILNGAFEKHQHRPPYRLSRGIMALDFFKYKNMNHFLTDFNFSGIEPFTMIVYDDGDLYEFRWDGDIPHVKSLNLQKQYLWASCTLYTSEWQNKRIQWLQEWSRKNPIKDQESILDFHSNAGEGNENNDLVMNRNNLVRTTSITSIEKTEGQLSIRMNNILSGKITNGLVHLKDNL